MAPSSMEIDVQTPSVATIYNNPVPQSRFKHKMLAETTPIDVLRWAEEVA